MAEFKKNTIDGSIDGNDNVNGHIFSSSKKSITAGNVNGKKFSSFINVNDNVGLQTRTSLAYLFNIHKGSFRSSIGTEKQLTPICNLKSKTPTDTKKQRTLSFSKLKLKVPKLLIKLLNVERYGRRFIRNSSKASRKRTYSVMKLRSVFSHVFCYDKKQKNMKCNENKKIDSFNRRGDLDWFKDRNKDTRKTDGDGESEKSLNYNEKLQQNCMALKLCKLSFFTLNLFRKKAFKKNRNCVIDHSSNNNSSSNSDNNEESEKEGGHMRTMNHRARNICKTVKRVVRMGGLDRGRELWKKPILMGERCQLPDFPGVLHYDEEGNPSTEPPTIKSKNSVLIKEWIGEVSTVDHDGKKDELVLIKGSRNSSSSSLVDDNDKSSKAVFMWERTPESSDIDYNGERRKNLGDLLYED